MTIMSPTSKTLAAIFRGLNTEYTLATLKGLQRGDLPDFPEIGACTATFAKDYLAYNIARKVRDPVLGITPPTEEQLVEKAVSGFLEVEAVCKTINRGRYTNWFPSEDILATDAVIMTARRKIENLLGDFNLDEFAASIDFSSGASTRLPRRRASVPHKFTGKPHVTRKCHFLAVNLMWYHEPWRRYCQDRFGRESDPLTWQEVVRGSEYFTVPKTATSLRGAAKEPELNMLCQKAIGNMIRKRLRRVRIDLNDQSRNRELAKEGSMTNQLATIDLSSASDSVSLRLVDDLLPPRWADFIGQTRSEEILLPDGTWHRLAKVSSMGNGFTFELESLIFWALSAACVDLLEVEDRRVGIYGDDIIVHTSVAPHLVSILGYYGFQTNKTKTFVEGPFRESCGGHYHYGVDVTPFYMRTDLSVLEDKYHFLNSLNIWLGARPGVIPHSTHAYVHRQLLEEQELIFVPPNLGTKAGLLAPSISVVPRVFFCLRRQMYAFRVFASSRKAKRLPTAPGYLAWLIGSLHDRLGEVLVDKSGVCRPRFKRALTSEWDDCEVVLPKYVLDL